MERTENEKSLQLWKWAFGEKLVWCTLRDRPDTGAKTQLSADNPFYLCRQSHHMFVSPKGLYHTNHILTRHRIRDALLLKTHHWGRHTWIIYLVESNLTIIPSIFSSLTFPPQKRVLIFSLWITFPCVQKEISILLPFKHIQEPVELRL